MALASRINDLDARQNLLGAAAAGTARTDPEKAFALLRDAQDLSPFKRFRYARVSAGQAAHKDPETALGLFEDFVEEQGYRAGEGFEEQRNRVYGSVFATWAESDIEAASVYAESLEDPQARGAALAALAEIQGRTERQR